MRWFHFPVVFLLVGQGWSAAETPTFTDNVVKVTKEPNPLVDTLMRICLAENLSDTPERIARALRDSGIAVEQTKPGPQLRVGVKRLTATDHEWWHHFETSKEQPWVDIIRFPNEDASRSVLQDSRQLHSGTHGVDHLAFFTTDKNARNTVSILVRKDEYLFNFGWDLPVPLRYPEANPPELLRQVSAAIDTLLLAMEAVARSAVAPDFQGYIAKANPTQAEIRHLRVAGFARMWSAVKENFVFFDQRPKLDWDGVLNVYLPRVMQCETHDEYLQLLREAMALLRAATRASSRGTLLTSRRYELSRSKAAQSSRRSAKRPNSNTPESASAWRFWKSTAYQLETCLRNATAIFPLRRTKIVKFVHFDAFSKDLQEETYPLNSRISRAILKRSFCTAPLNRIARRPIGSDEAESNSGNSVTPSRT